MSDTLVYHSDGRNNWKVSSTKEKNDPITYEDLLIAKYLEELKKSPPYTKTDTPLERSPYMQKLAHTHVVPTQSGSGGWPMSAKSAGGKTRPISGASDYGMAQNGKQKIDSKFIADPTLWEPASPPSDRRRNRPSSAPSMKRPGSCYGSSRPTSAYGSARPTSAYGGSRPMSAKSVPYSRRVRSLYRRKNKTISVLAFKNGCPEEFVRVTAPTLRLVLEACTDKLGLPRPARRMFGEDGNEIHDPSDIDPESRVVYISTGEAFKNPVKQIKHNMEAAQKSQWTMNGLVWAPDFNRKSTKPARMSERFRSLTEQSKRRVLVFQNGSGSHSVEMVTDPKKFDDFLTNCTTKLELGSCGRMLFDWDGNEVTNIDEVPVLDRCLQTWTTPVLGPVWISRGEGFSPKGVCEFLTGLINYTKSKLREAKSYKKQLQYAQNEDSKDQVEIVALLSMSAKEIEDSLKLAGQDIDDFNNALNRLQNQFDKLQDKLNEEQEKGSEFTMRHIKEYDIDHKLVGTKGIRLKVYENGSSDNWSVMYFNIQQAKRAIDKSKPVDPQMMEMLLEQCSNITSLAYPKKNPAIRPMAKLLFNEEGQEITSVNNLEYDQKVWLSFGEPWKNSSMLVLGLQFDKVKAVNLQDSEGNENLKAVREQMMSEDVKAIKLIEGKWHSSSKLPDDIYKKSVSNPAERDAFQEQLGNSEISTENSYFLQNKTKPKIVLYGEVVVNSKVAKKSGDIGWPVEPQTWVITKGGYIHSKKIPGVLGVTDRKISTVMRQSTGEIKLEGFTVALQKKLQSCASQQWTFTADGYICSQENPELVLTFIGQNPDDVEKESGKFRSGEKFFIAACNRTNNKDCAKTQRWGIKQEKFDNLGQWKYTDVENPEWHKQALSWPVRRDGSINEKTDKSEGYDWPMEGFLVPYAPSVNGPSSEKKDAPLRLQVLKNGMRDKKKAVSVVAPDLTTMKKGGHGKSKSVQAKKSTMENADVESIDDGVLHNYQCDPELNVFKLEFTMFLDRCTSQLDLPFPARRVFDENGMEHFSLRNLTRDQVVSVTCGEPWSDPNLSKAEQQRRFLLANLAADVDQIREYVSLRNPQNLVLEVENSFSPGARIIIGEVESNASDTSELTSRDTQLEPSLENGVESTEAGNSSHQMSHMKADERLDRMKWPWERLYNAGMDESVEVGDSPKKEQSSRSKRRTAGEGARLDRQKFVYEDGFIACDVDRNLVLGVQQQDGRSSVVVMKRSFEDLMQQWVIANNGLIQSKYDLQMVLSVGMSGKRQTSRLRCCHDDEVKHHLLTCLASYVGCSVILQRKKTVQFGHSMQRWRLDPSTGHIYAFNADLNDKEITAANFANVCTYSILGKLDIDQIGYVVDLSTEKASDAKKILVCSACARAMRGRYRLKKLEHSVDFTCAMGCAKEYGIQQIGSFHCLNGKVDLSTYEADHTLKYWEEELAKLKQEMSVRTLAKELSSASAPCTVKVTAYENGGNRSKRGETVVGSSVPGILDQCTKKMHLTQAARRLYTSDGTLVLHVNDLIDWAKENYVNEEKQFDKEDSKLKNSPTAGGDSNVQLNGEFENGEENQEAKEYVVGYDASQSREFIDGEQNCIIIPNPGEPIQESGLLVAWKIFAAKSGTIALNVFRSSGISSTYTLVGQSECQLTEGELIIDISGQPLPVQRGDLIGFHIGESGMIPYDVDASKSQSILYNIGSTSPPTLGQTITMKPSSDESMRQYSLMAKIIPAKSGNRRDSVVKKRPSSASRARSNPPSLDVILRHPIDVYVSCGEPFVTPDKSEKRQRSSDASYKLSKEKHVLRMMQGRRIDELNPGSFKSTSNPEQPVLLEGNWQELTSDEVEKHDIIHQLQMHVQSVKAAQKPKGVKTYNPSSTLRLYTQPNVKRILVFPNGEKIEMAQYVWGESMSQILDNSTTRLNLSKPAKCIFTIDGNLVEDFDEIERDQIVCVSSGKKFLQPQESQQLIEIKANWGRACKAYGKHSTDIVVAQPKIKNINVDPFAPVT